MLENCTIIKWKHHKQKPWTISLFPGTGGKKHKIRIQTNLDKFFVIYTQRANFISIQQTHKSTRTAKKKTPIFQWNKEWGGQTIYKNNLQKTLMTDYMKQRQVLSKLRNAYHNYSEILGLIWWQSIQDWGDGLKKEELLINV